MPYYEYRCDGNGRTVEVRHGMNEQLERWDQVAAAAGIEVGDTPADAPVERLMSVAAVGTGSSASGSGAGPGFSPGFGGCGAGCGCAHDA